MQTLNKKNPLDVVFLIEQSPMIGACFDIVLESYIKPLLRHFYGMPITDDIGVIKDLSGTVFSVIGYKSLDSLPFSVCSMIQPTSHVKLFYEKLESMFDFSYGIGEERSLMSEGIALALDIFDDLDNRHSRKSSRVIPTRHIVLISSQYSYEDIPVIESRTYRGLNLEDLLQNLTKKQINLSVISPKYSPDLIKLYEKVNRTSGEFKLEKIQNVNFCALLHKSIHLVEDVEVQQTQQQQIQFQQQQHSNVYVNPLSNKAADSELENTSLNTLNTIPVNSSSQNGTYPLSQATSLSQPGSQSSPGMSNIQSAQSQQQFQSSPQVTQPQNYIQGTQQQNIQQQSPLNIQQIHSNDPNYNQQQQILRQQQQQHQQQQIQQNSQQQQSNPQAKTQQFVRMQQNILPIQQQQTPPPPSQSHQIQQPKTPQQQQIQQPKTPQHIQSQTPPITITSNPQQQQQQQGMQANQIIMPNYNQQPGSVGSMPQMFNPQQQQQQQQQSPQQPVSTSFNQQPQHQSFPPNQSKSQIWEGLIEWQEKDRNNPNSNIRQNHSSKAIMLSPNVLDQASGQYQPEVSLQVVQAWPAKMSIQLLSKQILDFLTQNCVPPIKQLLLVTEGNNQDLKNVLSIGGGLIHFSNAQNMEIKSLLIVNQGNDVVCKISSDQNKFLLALRHIVSRQRQQQQQQQMQQTQQIQQNPQMQQNIQLQQQRPQVQQQQMGLNQSSPQNSNQINEPQKDLRNLLASGNQQNLIGIPQQKIQQPQQQQGWINSNPGQVQQQQSSGQQQQIYMNHQQKPGQNFSQFGNFDNYQN